MKKLAIVGFVAVVAIIGVWLWTGFPKPLAPAPHVSITADGGHVDISLTSNGVIIGKLVAKDGKPVPELGLAVVPDPGDGPAQIELHGPPPMSAADGSFRIEAKPGKVVLAVMTPGSPTTKRGLVVVAGETLDVGPVVVVLRSPK
jgi:hypothetical protein